jgi:Mn-dependent DtxR family transcriptional regulator
MARKQDEQRLQTIATMIQQYPGRKPGWIARILGLDNKTMMRALPQLEDSGYLLVEDEHGGVSFFGRRR